MILPNDDEIKEYFKEEAREYLTDKTEAELEIESNVFLEYLNTDVWDWITENVDSYLDNRCNNKDV